MLNLRVIGRLPDDSLPDGPGPSYVNLPAAGCWTLHLSWGGHTDRLMLRYVG